MAQGYIDKRLVDQTHASDRDQFIWDDGKAAIAGFGLKVTPKGKKLFIFQYRLKGRATPIRMEIGTYGAWTPHEAREQAKALRARVELGGDPAGERKANRARSIAEEAAKAEADRIAAESTVATIAERFLASIESKGGHRFYKSAINQHVIPTIGTIPIAEVTDVDIRRMMGRLDGTKAALPRAAFMAARAIWKYNRLELGKSAGFPCGNPFANIASPKAVKSRARVLSDNEIKLLWDASEKHGYPFGDMYRLLLLTAARRDEVASMKWDELDRAEAIWHIPEGRTKNGEGHTLHLSKLSIEILDAIARRRSNAPECGGKWPASGFVLTTNGDVAISGFSKAKARLDDEMKQALRKEAGDDAKLEAWRVHDIRRTVATRFQKLGVRFEVTEAVLNHVSGSRSGVAGIYQRYDWIDEKRKALDKWDRQLQLIIGRNQASNVIKIGPAQRA